MTTIRLRYRSFSFIVIWSTAVLFSFLGIAQDHRVIENPSTPLAKNAGRILQLKEIWRINDGSGDFYFKHPSGLEIAPNGCLFLKDEKQILRFGPDGKFQKNLYTLEKDSAANYFIVKYRLS
jgi:hypothetical protein